MNISEYDAYGRLQYARLAQTVRDILAAAMQGLPGIHLQQIQHRAKDVVSLRKKLAARGVGEGDAIETFIKDLAGCRLIFYTNSDVARFLHSAVIHDNFDVDWDRTKFHYPLDDTDADQLFVSYNYVLKLKAPRLELPEYSGLSDICCEVQVQTILDHAWSEMAHDTLYKPPVPGFGARRMTEVRKRMADIMNKHLLQAGFDFQKIMADVSQIRAAQAFFEQDPLQRLSRADQNGERAEILGDVLELLIPFYDDLAAIAPKIRTAVVDAVIKARAPLAGEEDTFTIYNVNSPHRVVTGACDILDRLCFIDEASVVETFDTLLSLHAGASQAKEKERIIGSVKRLSEHNLEVWRARGPLVEQLLVDKIRSLSELDIDMHRDVIIEALDNILDTEITGTTGGFDVVTFHTAAVVASPALTQIRNDACALLEAMFLRAHELQHQARIVQVFNSASRLPFRSEYSDELVLMTASAAIRFLRFFSGTWPKLGYEIRQKVEHDALWIHRHNALDGRLADDDNAAALRADLLGAIEGFREASSLDAEYSIFKILIGFNEVLPPYWEEESTDIEKVFRNQEIARLVSEIDAGSFELWALRLERFAMHRSSDGATFIYFSRFLTALAKAKPELATQLLDTASQDLARFIPDILSGLEDSPFVAGTLAKVDQWIAEGRYLRPVAHFLWRPKNVDRNRLERSFQAAIALGDKDVVRLCLRNGAEHALEHPALVESIMLPGIQFIADPETPEWIDEVVLGKGGLSGLASLTAEQAAIVIDALSVVPSITYWAEEALARLVPAHGEKVIGLFGQRLKAEQAREGHLDAIPFEFHVLPAHVDGLASATVEAARLWFEENEDLFAFRGGALVARLFPDVTKIEPHLVKRLDANGDKEFRFILAVLQSYSDGASARSQLCRELVARLEEGSVLLNEISVVLGQTGMLSGEFGMVEAERAQRDYMRSWLEDEREAVRQFAEREIRRVERSMAAEQRRSMEELQLRKRHWGAA